MAEKKEYRAYYTKEEKEEFTKRILQLMEYSQNRAVDQLMEFAELVLDDASSATYVRLEDTFSKRMIDQIKNFSEVKKSAKFRALEQLPKILEFEENMIDIYKEETEKYVVKGICSNYQTREHRRKKKNKTSAPKKKVNDSKAKKAEAKSVETPSALETPAKEELLAVEK